MKLIHRSEIKTNTVTDATIPMRIKTDTGWKMQNIFLKVQRICDNSPSKSLVVWDSSHHEVCLWFEDEKWLTYFELKGISEFMQ